MVVDILNSTKREVIRWIKMNLSKHNIKLKKRLSQIMLVEPRAYKRIIEITNECLKGIEKPVLIEIGAGLGTLTSALSRIDKVYTIAIEIDKRFIPMLKMVQEISPNVDIVLGDARTLLKAIRSVYIIVGNLPYHITSDLITAIGSINVPYSVITIQKDVADRLIAKPGSRNYGKITLFTQYLFDVKVIDILPPDFFIPVPDVFSAIVLLRRRRSYKEYAIVEKLIKCLFSFRRKYVLKSLRKCINVDSVSNLDMSDGIWKKRVYQLAPEDIDKLITILRKLDLK